MSFREFLNEGKDSDDVEKSEYKSLIKSLVDHFKTEKAFFKDLEELGGKPELCYISSKLDKEDGEDVIYGQWCDEECTYSWYWDGKIVNGNMIHDLTSEYETEDEDDDDYMSPEDIADEVMTDVESFENDAYDISTIFK